MYYKNYINYIIIQNMSNNICEILLNECFGGFRLSDKALEEYNNKLRELNQNHENLYHTQIYKLEHRMNPILIDIVKKLGNDANTQNSHITIKQINSTLKDYIKIDIYDGFESIYINNELYTKNMIKYILNSNINDSEKIIKIKQIINYDVEF